LFCQLPRKTRLASEQAWKMAGPYLSNRFRSGKPAKDQPSTAIKAVAAADLVVASGGAYVTDTWWWHAAGVLSLMALAQRLGKPTAMFGQGLGPIDQRGLRMQARSVLPHLTFLGLREDQTGQALARSLHIPPSIMAITGDDALELVDETGAASGKALGLNIRVANYANVNLTEAAAMCNLVSEAAATLNAPIVALPVSRHAADADVLQTLLRRRQNPADVDLDDIESPHALSAGAARCRAIVTGSYHAAVFGLAQGVPAVCLSRSPYYDAKFRGLHAQFPGACFVVPLEAWEKSDLVRSSIYRAWHLSNSARNAAYATAAKLRSAGREGYAQFRAAVEKTQATSTLGSPGRIR
jgi:polysaccharide pyruvyl transferase WcaK-like protein